MEKIENRGNMKFKDLGLSDYLVRNLAKENITDPTPIQELTIPVILEKRDLLGVAQTGSGKTAAYALPIIENQSKKEQKRVLKTLIICPTRELAMQVRNSFITLCNYSLSVTVIVGGIREKVQTNSLKKGVDVLVATPGRLNDLLRQRKVDLSKVDTIVLDEADTMLDMGFIKDIRTIISKVSDNRQTLMFSATMPKEIIKISEEFLNNPVKVEIAQKQENEPKIEQELYTVDKNAKAEFLLDYLVDNNISQAIIFTRTKFGADKLGKYLRSFNVSCTVIHGDKTQRERMRNLKEFKDNKVKYLIATDIAARGIDIIDLPCVVNYDLPEQAEIYVHRIGRTGRAGKIGKAISICGKDEIGRLVGIEKLIKHEIPLITDNKYHKSYEKSRNFNGKNQNYKKRSHRRNHRRKTNYRAKI